MNNKITVIVPVFNCEKVLKKCLDSLCNQTYESYDVILVDDGSEDGSGRICEEYSSDYSNIKVVHQKNSGVSEARNRGLELSEGEYITFVDADDYIDTHYLSMLYHLLKSNNADFVQTDFVRTNSSCEAVWKEPLGYSIEKISAADALKLLLVSKKVTGYVCGKLFKKSILEGILFDSSLTYGEDLYFVQQILHRANNIILSDYSGYAYVENETSATFGKLKETHLNILMRLNELEKKETNNDLRDYWTIERITLARLFLNRLIRTGKCKEYYQKLRKESLRGFLHTLLHVRGAYSKGVIKITVLLLIAPGVYINLIQNNT